MNNEELADWLLNKIFSCYPVKMLENDNITFWYYDKIFHRKLKLSKLNNTKIEYPKNITGICIFEQDIKNKQLCFNYDEIWKILFDNYSDDIDDINFLIMNTLKDSEFNSYTPVESMNIETQFQKYGLKIPDNVNQFKYKHKHKHNLISKKQLKSKLKSKLKFKIKIPKISNADFKNLCIKYNTNINIMSSFITNNKKIRIFDKVGLIINTNAYIPKSK